MYKIQGASNPSEPKETEGGKTEGAGGVIPCLTFIYCIVGTTPGVAVFQVIPGHAFEIYCTNPDVSISPVTFVF